MTQSAADLHIFGLTSTVVSAFASKNGMAANDLPPLIKAVFSALSGVQPGLEPAPAVPVRKSVLLDYVICLEDGARLKMLKPYIRTRFGLTPEQYRVKWGLPPDYPMVAPNYSARRSAMAKSTGLGSKRAASAPPAAEAPPAAKRGRTKKAAP